MMTKLTLSAVILALSPTLTFAHGDVAPQAVDTTGLPVNGEEWLIENPYRADAVGEETWALAVSIGSSGYNQNCARCHGLEVISGGLAPDLRFLEAEEYGDEWFMERFREGYTQNGITKMPAFGELLGQDAAWAIRTYVETRPDDDSMADEADELKSIRDILTAGGGDLDDIKTRLTTIAARIETVSGAPVADSAASRAAALLDGSDLGVTRATEALTIGLSAAN